ncbi:hypothetical protein HBI25_227450 [Parastagonospora nodorum]|nr:hypothetical protein HBH52_021940 [Parastagonospora nodorum]KAH4057944.1 hypothetical protein HBH50_233930 [Parastagonospora nodorum]KAH4078467.1 hypothetical protein HBH48_230920 [Parastagonospora nodorum]KAH4310346.1 hypothetical protein HBI01_021890 [Parastagonospora nodorum]KAH4315461.1 hypothetical protein HBI02_058250 [Parastagonospora nodorum]
MIGDEASAGAPERDSRSGNYEAVKQNTSGTHNMTSPTNSSEHGEGENITTRSWSVNDVFSNWEDRYKPESQISQADFFRPTELASQSARTTRAILSIEDIGQPMQPSVPRITLTEPEDHVTTPGSSQPTLVTAHADQKTHFQPKQRTGLTHERSALERRHSSVMPESWDESHNAWGTSTRKLPTVSSQPQEWTATTTSPKRGWTMKTRNSTSHKLLPSVDIVMVYMYDSALCDEDLDKDADLNPFRCRVTTGIDIMDTSPPKKIRRARTEITKQQNETSATFHLSRGRQVHRGELSRYTEDSKDIFVNWLHDENMLERQMHGSRISTIGFDISPKSSAPDDLESAAEQLNEHLHVLRHEHQPPILLLGHGYGSLIIISSLSFASTPTSRFKSILKNAAGLFIFSYPDLDQTPNKDMTADRKYKDVKTEKIERLHSSALKISGQTVDSKLFSVLKKEHEAVQDTGPGSNAHSRSQVIPIALPVFHSVVSFQQRSSDARFNKMLGAPPQFVVMSKEDKNLALFTSSTDTDFQRLIVSLQKALHTRQLLVAAAMASIHDIQSTIKSSTDLNLADRWGQTTLHLAVRLDNEVVVHRLLRQPSIDVNARDLRSNTALHHAVRKGNEAIITALLHHGADVEIKNTRKKTARDIAESRASRKAIAKMLRSRLVSGPETNAVAKRFGDGRPPVSEQGKSACMNSQITITEMFKSGTSDKYWSVDVSVASFLYGKTEIDDILQQVRPRKVQGKSPLCTWIHIPENNLIWVEDLFDRLHLQNLNQSFWKSTRQWITSSLRNRTITPHAKSDQMHSTFIPYLSYEAQHLQTKRAKYIRSMHTRHLEKEGLSSLPQIVFPAVVQTEKLRIPQAIDRNIHPYRDDSESDGFDDTNASDSEDIEEEEKASISTYLNGPPALHTRRTLDQFYYHMLENTTERDQSQVVSRWSQRDDPAAQHNILMVDQLWLWAFSIDQSGLKREVIRSEEEWLPPGGYIVTSFPGRVGAGRTPRQKHDDLRLQILEPSGRKRNPISRPADLVSRILETCCAIFDRLHEVEELRFFIMFESSIGSLVSLMKNVKLAISTYNHKDDKESRLFRTFQNQSTQLLDLDATNKYYQERKNTLLRNMLDIRKEIEFLVEVKDIRDEINIILSVLHVQQNVIGQMKALADPLLFPNEMTAESLIETDIADFARLNEQARSIQDKLETLMDLKQKAANAWEAREARETAVAASKQGNIVLVFTVVTIIFLPLSFMSAFFTIGISAFPKDRVSGETSWPMGLVTAILFGVSLCVSLPLIAFALNMDYCSAMFNELRYNYCAHGCIKLIKILPHPAAHRRLNSRRTDWLERLKKSREQYLRVEVDHMVPDDTEGRAKRMASAMLRASMPTGTQTRGRMSSSNDASIASRTSNVFQKLRRRGRKEDEECLFPEA